MAVWQSILYYGVCDVCGETAEESRNEYANAVYDAEILTEEHKDWVAGLEPDKRGPHTW